MAQRMGLSIPSSIGFHAPRLNPEHQPGWTSMRGMRAGQDPSISEELLGSIAPSTQLWDAVGDLLEPEGSGLVLTMGRLGRKGPGGVSNMQQHHG